LTCSAALFIVAGTPRLSESSIVPDLLGLAILVATLLVAVLAGFGSRLLLRWYLHEVRAMKIAEQPGEAIITYPLA